MRMFHSALGSHVEFSHVDFPLSFISDESNAHTLILKLLHLVKVTCSPLLNEKLECSEYQFKEILQTLEKLELHTVIGGRYMYYNYAISYLNT